MLTLNITGKRFLNKKKQQTNKQNKTTKQKHKQIEFLYVGLSTTSISQ